MAQPINYKDHDVDYAFKILQSNKPYSVQSLSNVVIKFKQDVFVTDKLTFDFIKFSSEFIEKYPEITNVADLGTGSGVIGVTLAKLHPSKDFAALDISTQALELAKLNAQTNRVANIKFIKSQSRQWIPEDYSEPIDLIISNPPFIGSEEWSDPKLLTDFPDCKNQPLEALKTEDKYGISEYIAITQAAKQRRVKWIIFRLNSSYVDKVLNALKKYSKAAEPITTSNGCPLVVIKVR